MKKGILPKVAVLRSSISSRSSDRIGGLSLIERNIRLLWHSGFDCVYLDLNSKEHQHYIEKVAAKVKPLSGIKIIEAKPSIKDSPILEMSSSQFIQYHQLIEFTSFFSFIKGRYVPVSGNDVFVIKTSLDMRRAENIAYEHIRNSTSGWIARNINKRISIQFSRILARLRIHPNVITIANFIIMIAGACFLWKGGYLNFLIAGIVFQVVSIIDGCDGEVAKINNMFSRSGGLMDTISDYTAVFLYLGIAGMHYYSVVSHTIFIWTIVFAAFGVIAIVISSIIYIVKYSNSTSFIAYQKEFLTTLPLTDIWVWLAVKGQYFIRKEFYSWMAFFFGIAGILPMMLPYTAVSAFVGAVLVIIADIKYFPTLKERKKKIEMGYISKRAVK